jgi:uncharacterized repeat protein (TIGR01451 family)
MDGTLLQDMASPGGYFPGSPADVSDVFEEITSDICDVTINKQRMSASTVMPGGSVTYSITVTNAGNVSLDNVDVSDTYDPAYLSFVSASPAATTSGSGSITWNNLTHSRSDGLPTVWESGKARTITVTFTALGRSKIRRTAPAWSQTR